MAFINAILEKVPSSVTDDFNLEVVTTFPVDNDMPAYIPSREDVEKLIGSSKSIENMYVGICFIDRSQNDKFTPLYLYKPGGQVHIREEPLLSKFKDIVIKVCAPRKPLLQQRGTCWFNSIINGLINSERFRCWTDTKCGTLGDSERGKLLQTMQGMMRGKNRNDLPVSDLIKMFGLVERIFLVTDGGNPVFVLPRMFTKLGLSFEKSSYEDALLRPGVVRSDKDVLIIAQLNPLSPWFDTKYGIPREIGKWVLDHAAIQMGIKGRLLEAHIMTCIMSCDKPMIMDSNYAGADAAVPFDWTKNVLDPIPFPQYKDIVDRNGLRFLYICYVNQEKLKKCEGYHHQMSAGRGSTHPTRVLSTLLLAFLATVASSVM